MKTRIQATREHTIDCGHRVVGHGGKCQHLHGHGYLFKFYLEATELDSLGMVLDFGVIKSHLCQWLEVNWDHKTLIFIADPWLPKLKELTPDSIVQVPFNPTAENIGEFFLHQVAPGLLRGLPNTPVLTKLEIHETRKCSVVVSLSTKD